MGMDSHLDAFDNMVDGSIMRMTASPLGAMPHHSKDIRGLSLDRGGLGIRRLHVVMTAAWASSFLHANFMLAKNYRDLVNFISSYQYTLGTFTRTLGLLADFRPDSVFMREPRQVHADRPTRLCHVDWPRAEQGQLPQYEPLPQKSFNAEIDGDIERRLLEEMREDESKHLDAAWLVSNQYKGSGSILLPYAPRPALNLDGLHFSIHLATRLLLPLSSSDTRYNNSDKIQSSPIPNLLLPSSSSSILPPNNSNNNLSSDLNDRVNGNDAVDDDVGTLREANSVDVGFNYNSSLPSKSTSSSSSSSTNKHHQLPPPPQHRPSSSSSLLPPLRAPSTQCLGCNNPNCASQGRFHAYNCRTLQKLQIARHDAVKNALADLLRRIVGKNCVSTEFMPFSDTPLITASSAQAADSLPAAAAAAPSGDLLMAFDIRAVFPGGRVLLFDISIANPACSKMVKKFKSHMVAGAAARAHQNLKALKYDGLVNALRLDKSSFISFSVEATGRLGPMASDFLKTTLERIANLNADTLASSVRFFKRRMRYLLASFNAQLIASFSKSSRELWQPASLLYQYHRSSLSGLDSGIGMVDKNLSVYDDLEDDDSELHWTSSLPQASKSPDPSPEDPTSDSIDDILNAVNEPCGGGGCGGSDTIYSQALLMEVLDN